jgi:hypothetical protein
MLRMSVYRDRPEVTGRRSEGRNSPSSDIYYDSHRICYEGYKQSSPHKPAIREHKRLNAPETCRQRSEPPWLRKSAEPARIFGRLAWRKRPRAEVYAASETAHCHPPMCWGLLVQAPRPRLPSRYNRRRRPRELPPLSTRPRPSVQARAGVDLHRFECAIAIAYLRPLPRTKTP